MPGLKSIGAIGSLSAKTPAGSVPKAPPPNKTAGRPLPNLSLPSGLDVTRFHERLDLLHTIGAQQAALERVAENENFDRHRQKAISLLADRKTQQAFNVADADPRSLLPDLGRARRGDRRRRPDRGELSGRDDPGLGRGRLRRHPSEALAPRWVAFHKFK